MPIVTLRLGSSTEVTGSGRGSSGSAIVSPIVTSGSPASATISPGPGLVGGNAVERLGDVQLDDAGVLDLAVRAAPRDLLALAQRAVPDPQQRQPADVRARVEVRDERLQRMVRVVGRCGDRLEQRLEQRLERRGEGLGVETGAAVARDRVDDRELDLLAARVEVEEELVDLVDDLVDARVRPVDLVHDEHDRQLRLERLAEHEPRLRQRALRRVDEQEHAVDHRQRALDLAAEVGVARRVDDVDLRVAVAAPPCSWRGS